MRNNRYDRYDYDYRYNDYSDDEATNEEIFGYLRNLWGAVTGEFGKYIKNVKQNFKNANTLTDAKKASSTALDGMAKTTKDAIDSAKDVDSIMPLIEEFEKSVKKMAEEFKSVPKQILAGTYAKNESYETINENLMAAIETLGGFIKDTFSYMSKEWKKRYEPIKTKYEERKKMLELAKRDAKNARISAIERKKAQETLKKLEMECEELAKEYLDTAKKGAKQFVDNAVKEVKKEINATVFSQGQSQAQSKSVGLVGSLKREEIVKNEGRFVKTFEGFVYRHY